MPLHSRLDFSKSMALDAGKVAFRHFQAIGDLVIEQKGMQDLVSNADREVELFVREQIAARYPDDGIVGEEYENVAGRSGFTWVIDPIDGTANFVRAIPAWTVVLACVRDDRTELGVIYDPCHDELYWCARGHGAFVNEKPSRVALTNGLDDGSVGVGFSTRRPGKSVIAFMADLLDRGGVFYRNASGALMLAYVASGRLIGYVEPHMNAWDCLAGQLLVEESGGLCEKQSANAMLAEGGRVIVASPPVFDELLAMADIAFPA